MTEREPTMAIIERAAKRFGLTAADVLSKNRLKSVAHARHLAAWLLRDQGWSYQEIGKILGRHHTTVMNSVEWVELEMCMRPELVAQLSELRLNGASAGPMSSSESNTEVAHP